MSSSSLQNSIQFLRLRRRGYDPEEFLQARLARNTQIGQRATDAAIVPLTHTQNIFEGQVAPIVGRLAALDVTQPGQQAAQEIKGQLKDLQDIRAELQIALAKKTEELRMRNIGATMLTQKLKSLSKDIRQLPHPYEDPIMEFGVEITKFIGQK